MKWHPFGGAFLLRIFRRCVLNCTLGQASGVFMQKGEPLINTALAEHRRVKNRQNIVVYLLGFVQYNYF